MWLQQDVRREKFKTYLAVIFFQLALCLSLISLTMTFLFSLGSVQSLLKKLEASKISQ